MGNNPLLQIMYDMHRFFHSIARWPRSYGFGVQSPFAFRFVTEVVRSRTQPSDLPESFYGTFTTSNRRLLRFYGRLYDFLQHEEGVDSVYIVEGIHADAATHSLWLSLIALDKVVVSFDLYDCGVLFLEGKMPKFNYKVMLR